MRSRALGIAALFLLPNLLGFLAFTLFPVVASFALSFCRWDPVAQPVSAIEPAGFRNYLDLLGFHSQTDPGGQTSWVANTPRFWESLYNTFFMMLAIPFNMAASLLLAVLLNRKMRGMAIFRTAFFLPSITAGVGTMLLWMWMFNKDLGSINQVLAWVGIQGPDWLQSYLWAKPALMLMASWASIGGVNMILYLAGLQQIPRELHEAAALDGAGRWQQLRHVTVPMLLPVTFFIFIISIISGLEGGFDAPYVMTGGSFGTTTVSLYLYRQGFEFFRMGYASAVAWVLFLIVFLFTMINWRLAEKRVEY